MSSVPESGVPNENGRFAPPNGLQGDEQQIAWAAVSRHPQEMNGHCEGSASTSSSSKRSRTPRNVLPDRESKSNNINKMPDRNQVVTRLNQIQDYIKQTSSLMDTLKNSGEPRHQEQYQKLSKMIADLKESEKRLRGFLPELGNIPEQNDQENNCNSEVISEAGSCMPDRASGSVNSNSISVPISGVRGMNDSCFSSRSFSEEPSGAVLKSSDSTRRNELKMKVEESQRKLQALQEHQAALMTLQQKAQDQLKEAKAAQGILMARAVGIQCTGPPPPPLTLPAADSHSSCCPNSASSSQTGTSVIQQSMNSSPPLQGNIQNLTERLHTLQELYENRNQLVQMLGERDEELVSEHLVLQDKLRELQYKKQHMDHLVTKFQALNSIPGDATGSQTDGGSSKDGSEDGDADFSEGEPDYQVVRDKIAELNMMKAQLAQLKGIMSEVETRASASGISQNITDESVRVGEDGEEFENEEQAVNLRRQKRDKGKGRSDGGVVRSNSNTSASSSNKPDNIVQACSEVERVRDIQNKTLQLQEAKSRLQHLQDLLAAVSDFHNRGQPVPVQYLELLNQETVREEGAGDAGRVDAQAVAESRSVRRSVERERTPVGQQVQNSSNELPENSEVTLEVVQAMTRDLRQQTLSLQEERERLISARRELGKLQRELPLREKKTNTQVDAQTHQQMLLQAELQAKKRELEELMRKDQGQTSVINQDVCSEVSADKSETPGYSFLAEGTTNATWGGSTQGTLDDLAEQDNDIQEQSAGYSSDEGQDDDEEDDHRFCASSSQQMRLSQLNNNNNNSNKEPLSQSLTTTRDLLSMSLDSGRVSLSGNINTNHSNTTSIAGSSSQAPPPTGNSRSQRQSSSSHNVWRKESVDSGTSAPRAVWTPSSQQARQENLCTAEDLISSNNLDTNNSSSTATLHNAGASNPNPNSNWWQQQALQLQHQLEATNNLCQSMLLDQVQQQHQLQQHGNNLLPTLGGANNVLPYWGVPPPSFVMPPHPQAQSLTSGGIGHLLPTTDAYYQQLLAASQLQQQQMLLTTVNQCCHLLWLQQREIMTLRAAVHALQEKSPCGNGSRRGENYTPPIVMAQPEEAILITSNQNSTQPTPHQSQSNLTRLQQSTANPSLSTFSPHQNLKLSYSGGLFQSPEEPTGSSGVTSAHSLPNLSQTNTSANSVFSPHHMENFPPNAPLNNVTPSFNSSSSQTSARSFPTGTLTLTFPMNNNVNCNNRSQQQPMSSLIQCSAPQPGSGAAPWLQQGAPGGTPGLLQGHTTPSPVPALNNQVPPGNRANNYWDNFRSYSRQNLLSANTKSNEGVSHSPSPLVDRSHNTLRGSVSQTSSFVAPSLQPSASLLTQSIGTVFSGPDQNGPMYNMSHKEKLNTKHYQSSQETLSLPALPHTNMSDTTGLQFQLIGTPTSTSSRPRSRNRHNSSDFQLQAQGSRSRTLSNSQNQPLTNDNIPQDLQFQTNVAELRSLDACASSASNQVMLNHQNFSSVSDYQFESDITVETRNISLARQDLQENQNFTSSESSNYQNNPNVRDQEEPELIHDSKMHETKAHGINKRKNPKTVTPETSQSQPNCQTSLDFAGCTSDRKHHQATNTLFEALSESVYSEVAALISANENRPHFLIQLFRDLQMISSDPLRQRTLQSIQEVVSQYLASGTTDDTESSQSCQPQADEQQELQNEVNTIRNDRIPAGSAVSDDEENVKNNGSHYHLVEPLNSSLVGSSSDSRLTGRCESESGPHSIAESEEGAAALLPSSHSSPRTLPRNAAWNLKDGLSLPTELPGRSSKLDWEVQAVLVDLLPFLKAHLDDTCSTSLLEAVRRLTLQLVPAQNMSVISNPMQHSSQHSRLGCCYQGQLDALLEDALLKFQGCRLRDVGEELLTVVAEVLLSELTFLRLVDTVSRGDNTNETQEECCKNPALREHDLEEQSKTSAASHQPCETNQHFLSQEIGNHEISLGADGYNGDLAEADQSHHEESVGGIPELEAESAAAMAVVEEDLLDLQNNQAEGTSVSDQCLLENSLDTVETDLAQADGMMNERNGNYIKTEVEEEWEVEQDREQGLDRVPTRLSTEQLRPGGCSGRSTPERDNHNLAPHPTNQTDAPAP